MPNGNADYQIKQPPNTSQPMSHQYHGQNQQSPNNVGSSNSQRKHHQQQQHHHLVGKGDFNSRLIIFVACVPSGVVSEDSSYLV